MTLTSGRFQRLAFGLVACLWGLSSTAKAQDALEAAPTIYRKVLENDRMRVLEGTFKRGARIGLHSHPDHMLYVVTDGALTFKPVGRTPFEMTFKAGEAFSLPAQTRAVENDSDNDVRILVVELKQAKAAAPQSARGKRTVSKGKGKRKSRAARRR